MTTWLPVLFLLVSLAAAVGVVVSIVRALFPLTTHPSSIMTTSAAPRP